MPPPPERLPRFSAAERRVHRSFGLLMGVALTTAAMLYIGPLSALVGNRHLVATVHLVAGLLLPAPLIAGFALSKTFREDARRLNRFRPGDWNWLRSSRFRTSAANRSGKFNAGQKLNAAFTVGAVVVLFATGLMLHYFDLFTDDIRTGATFVHDWTALAASVTIFGHIWMASQDAEARRGMRRGTVDPGWARSEHPAWANEFERPDDEPDDGGPHAATL